MYLSLSFLSLIFIKYKIRKVDQLFPMAYSEEQNGLILPKYSLQICYSSTLLLLIATLQGTKKIKSSIRIKPSMGGFPMESTLIALNSDHSLQPPFCNVGICSRHCWCSVQNQSTTQEHTFLNCCELYPSPENYPQPAQAKLSRNAWKVMSSSLRVTHSQ